MPTMTDQPIPSIHSLNYAILEHWCGCRTGRRLKLSPRNVLLPRRSSMNITPWENT